MAIVSFLHQELLEMWLSDYDEWLGKAFLLIADNYIALNELFQAKATINSVIEYSPVASIVEQAKLKLSDIEKLEQAQRQQMIKSDSVRTDSTGIQKGGDND